MTRCCSATAMHELSICQALIEQVEAIAREQQAVQVLHIRISVGLLSGVEPDLLELAFSIARAGTIAADARLDITRLPIRVRCRQCGQSSDAQPANLICGHCGDWHTQLLSGDELLLSQVELVRTPQVETLENRASSAAGGMPN